MADDIVRIKYEADLSLLKQQQSELAADQNTLKDNAQATSKAMVEGSQAAAKSYEKVGRTLKEVSTTSAAAFETGRVKKYVEQANQAEKATDKLGKTMKKTTDHTGLAGNATIELGRTLSDAQYGIRGVANNVQQLGANFAQLVKSTGGVKTALKAVLSTFKGPLGLLVLFQGAVSLLQVFTERNQRAKRAAEENAKATSSQTKAVEYQTAQRKKLNKELRETEQRISNITKLSKEEIALQVAQAESRISLNQKLLESITTLTGSEEIAADATIKYGADVFEANQRVIKSIDEMTAAERRRASSTTAQDYIDANIEYASVAGQIANDERFIAAARDALAKSSKSSGKEQVKAGKEYIKINEGIASSLEKIRLSDDQKVDVLLSLYGVDAAAGDLERARQTAKQLEQVSKELNEDIKDDEKSRLDAQQQQVIDFAMSVGQTFGTLFSEQEDRQKEFLKELTTTLITAIQNQLRLQYVNIIARDGFIVGGLKVAALEAAFTAAKSKIQSFHDGTEDTGHGGRVDNKGGFHAILHPNERVVPKAINQKLGDIPNIELPKAVQMYQISQGFGEKIAASVNLTQALNDERIVKSNYTVAKEVTKLRNQLSKSNRNRRNGF